MIIVAYALVIVVAFVDSGKVICLDGYQYSTRELFGDNLKTALVDKQGHPKKCEDSDGNLQS